MRNLCWVLVLVTLSACTAEPPPAPDIVYTNGHIWTGDMTRPWVQAMAIRDGRITAIGRAQNIVFMSDSTTDVRDLEQSFVFPGFIDNHAHFMSGGYQLASVDLRDADSPDAFTGRLRAFAETLPEGRWIQGGDWDHEAWGGTLPERGWIDAATPDNPVFVNRLDGHMALVNTLALEMAGITRDTPDPAGGTIVRDPATGEPTGVLKDEAMALVYPVIPPYTEEEQDEALARAMAHALSQGVTQVHAMETWQSLAAFRRAHDRGQLRLRINAFVPLGSWQQMEAYIEEHGRGDDWLRWGGLKGFVDGSLGSTTAWFYDPYTDEPETNGLLVTDTTTLRTSILAADEREMQLAIHAIGDQANDWLLDVFAEAAEKHGPRDRRFRIEHAQHLSPEALTRFAEQQVIPSMQPYHAIDDGRWAEKRIGSERLRTTYAFRSLLNADAPLTFGSDWTVAPISPLQGIYAAVTRRTLDGANPKGWVPEEKIKVQQALEAYTLANAYAGFQEDRLGKLTEGMLADFVALSDDLFEVDRTAIKDVKVRLTVVNGIERYRAR